MSLKPKFNKESIRKSIERQAIAINETILRRFQLIGEEFVNSARSKVADIVIIEQNGIKKAFHKFGPRVKLITEGTPGFIDHTGNLRSSIGYVILKDGKKVIENFEKAKDGSTGVQTGRSMVTKLKKDFKNGYALIVIAGMNYAAAVESKGFAVLSGSNKQAEKELTDFITNFKKQLKNRKL